MPTTPYAKLRVSLDGGANRTGGIEDATVGQMVQLSTENTSGITQYKWTISDAPPDFVCPAGWTDAGDGAFFSTDAVPTAFELTHWGKYLLDLRVNDAARNISAAPKLTDSGTTALAVRSPEGLRDLSYRESQQFNRKGWPDELRRDLRTLRTMATGHSALSSVCYINDVTGDDTNDGLTTGTAWQSFVPLAERAGSVLQSDCHVKIYPHASDGYDPTPLSGVKGYRGYLILDGQGTVTTVGSLTVASVPSTKKTDFGSPGWTIKAYVGQHLKCLTGANAGVSRKILYNDADEVYHDEFPSAVSPGDTFQIVRPAVVFEIPSATTPISGGLVGGDYSTESPGPVFHNIEFSMPNEFEALQFTGQGYFFGVILSTTGSFAQLATFSLGRVYAGLTTYYDAFAAWGLPDTKLDGFGLSTIGVSGGRAPILTFSNCRAEIKGSTARGMLVQPGCRITVESGFFESQDAQPHGAIAVSHSYLYFINGPTYLISGGTAYATMLIEGAEVEVLGDVQQLSGTAPVIVRYPGALVYNQAQPTLGGQVQALNGGKVRINGVDGALTAGGFLAGYSGETAASFANIGDRITSDDGSSVERSS